MGTVTPIHSDLIDKFNRVAAQAKFCAKHDYDGCDLAQLREAQDALEKEVTGTMNQRARAWHDGTLAGIRELYASRLGKQEGGTA